MKKSVWLCICSILLIGFLMGTVRYRLQKYFPFLKRSTQGRPTLLQKFKGTSFYKKRVDPTLKTWQKFKEGHQYRELKQVKETGSKGAQYEQRKKQLKKAEETGKKISSYLINFKDNVMRIFTSTPAKHVKPYPRYTISSPF